MKGNKLIVLALAILVLLVNVYSESNTEDMNDSEGNLTFIWKRPIAKEKDRQYAKHFVLQSITKNARKILQEKTTNIVVYVVSGMENSNLLVFQ